MLVEYSSVKVERNIEEAIGVAHVHLQPVARRVQLHFHALAKHFEALRLIVVRYFDFFRVDVLTEQLGELVHEDLADRQTQLLLLPCFENWVHFRHAGAVGSNWLVGNPFVDLHVSMVQIAEDSNGVLLEVSDRPKQM